MATKVDFPSNSYGFALAVLSRTINSGSTVMAFGYGVFASALMRRKSVSAAMTPIWCKGCRTVVSAGYWNAAL